MRRGILSAGIAVLTTAVLQVALPSAQQPSPLFTQGGSIPVLDSYLEALRQQAGIPGMAAAVMLDGETVWEKGYGFANTATRERVTPDTPFMVGDMSGTLAAVLLLQCVEQRHLELDQPVSRYGLSSPEPDATLRGLLSHAAPGAGRVTGGEPFAYSPERYSSLTALMEWCAPQPYRKSVSHRVLNRLAMRDSVPGTDLIDPNLALPDDLFAPDELERYRTVLQRIAVPYKVTGRTRADRMELPVAPMTASGGLVSTVRDLARLDRALSPNGVLLLDETLAAAWTPAFDRSGQATPMGLGWFVQFHRGERVVWHFGQVPNAYSALILKLPLKRITFILLANSDGLSNPFQLQSGDVTRSLFATIFLKLTT
ncbi:MAG TPA: serine hydrolase domain-containing protein [Vicinamibacterales bacterium]|nr:serine hydrolase domain-containing protein [Vicinamibacterales bacterium]